MSVYEKKSKAIAIGSPDAARSVIIFHGYSSSPDEFLPLAQSISKRLNARVLVPLLPGHGTNESDLLNYSFDDLLNFARRHVAEIAQSGKPFAVMGHSFGGYLALITAAEYPPAAIIVTVTPISLPFPLNLPGVATLMRFKQFWEKRLSVEEKIARVGLFYYRMMPGFALSLVRKGNIRIRAAMRKITCPIMTVHTEKDPIAAPDSGEILLRMTKSHPQSTRIVMNNLEHGIFYGHGWREAVNDVTTFLEKVMLKK